MSEQSGERLEVWPGRAYPLGAVYDGAGTNFALFSEVAEAVDLCLFDDDGAVTARHRLGAQSAAGRLWGVDIEPGVWHTILPRTDRVVCFEVKPGPWVPATDKEFADWAPAENSPGVAAYCRKILGD